MADTEQSKPKPSKSERTLWELPGVFKVGLISEDDRREPMGRHNHFGVTAPAAMIALAILCALFAMLGRRKRG
jgi:hypothetical protein